MSEKTQSANERAGMLLRHLKVMNRFSIREQNNLVAGISVIYCCRVERWSLPLYEQCLKKMTTEEYATVIEYVMTLLP